MIKTLLKSIICFLLYVCLGSPVSAEEQKSMILHTRNGKTMFFELDKNPETIFINDHIRINAAGFSVEYPLEHLIKYTFSSEEAGVNGPSDNRIKISRIDNTIYIDGLDAKDAIEIIGGDGKIIQTVQEYATENHTIDISSLPQGIYIIKVGRTTLKVIK